MITKDPIELYLEKYLGIIKDVHNTIDGADSNYHYYQGVIDAIESVLVKLNDKAVNHG